MREGPTNTSVSTLPRSLFQIARHSFESPSRRARRISCTNALRRHSSYTGCVGLQPYRAPDLSTCPPMPARADEIGEPAPWPASTSTGHEVDRIMFLDARTRAIIDCSAQCSAQRSAESQSKSGLSRHKHTWCFLPLFACVQGDIAFFKVCSFRSLAPREPTRLNRRACRPSPIAMLGSRIPRLVKAGRPSSRYQTENLPEPPAKRSVQTAELFGHVQEGFQDERHWMTWCTRGLIGCGRPAVAGCDSISRPPRNKTGEPRSARLGLGLPLT